MCVVYGIGVVCLLRGMDGCWSGVWVWCDDIGRGVYIKNFASATFVVEAI